MSKNVFWVVAGLPQRLKSTFLEIFLTPLAPSELLRSKKFQTTLILAFEANSALSQENETKIVKITHSAVCMERRRDRILLACHHLRYFKRFAQKNGR